MYSFSGSQKTRFRKIQDLDSSTTSSAIEANEKKRQVFYDSKEFDDHKESDLRLSLMERDIEITRKLIESITKLKKLVDETRIIDEIDDEVWLLNFIEELEIHLTYLCSPNKTKKPSSIKQKETLLQVSNDLINYLQKRLTDEEFSSKGGLLLRSDSFRNNTWELKLKNLVASLNQCLINLQNTPSNESTGSNAITSITRDFLKDQDFEQIHSINVKIEQDLKTLTINIQQKESPLFVNSLKMDAKYSDRVIDCANAKISDSIESDPKRLFHVLDFQSLDEQHISDGTSKIHFEEIPGNIDDKNKQIKDVSGEIEFLKNLLQDKKKNEQRDEYLKKNEEEMKMMRSKVVILQEQMESYKQEVDLLQKDHNKLVERKLKIEEKLNNIKKSLNRDEQELNKFDETIEKKENRSWNGHDFGCQVEDESYMKMKAYDFYYKEAQLKAKKLLERGENFHRESIERMKKNRLRKWKK